MKKAAVLLAFATAVGVPAVFANSIERVSVNAARQQGDAASQGPVLSPDGRYVGYNSSATNLVPGDTNGVLDGFLYDRKTGVTERVTVAHDGGQLAAGGYVDGLSENARFVLCSSAAPDVVPGVGNWQTQLYLRDRDSGETILVSCTAGGDPASTGASAAALTPDGRFVLFYSTADNLVDGDTNGAPLELAGGTLAPNRQGYDGFVFDRDTGTVERVTLGPGDIEPDRNSFPGGISDDGRYVTFRSYATNLGNGITDADEIQVYLRDRDTGSVVHVSIAVDGSPADLWSGWDTISGDGGTISFGSQATNLVGDDTNGDPSAPFDPSGTDVFVVDRTVAGTPGAIERVSLSATGAQANGGGFEPKMSRDGRFVVFFSEATNLVPGDANGAQADVILVDRRKGLVERLNHANSGAQSNLAALNPVISATGQIVAFWSRAGNLVPGDTNNAFDVFVVQRQLPPPLPVDIVDNDGDGLDDDWEIQHFGDLRFTGADDPNGDGLTNAEHLAAGTNPYGFVQSIQAGWNLLSLPHTLEHRSLTELFGTRALPTGWTWDAAARTYVETSHVHAAGGVWVRIRADSAPGPDTTRIALP